MKLRFLYMTLSDYLKGVLTVSAPRLGGFGGFYRKSSTTSSAAAKLTTNSTIMSSSTCFREASLSASPSSTMMEGSTNPTPEPMMLTTDSTAVATGLCANTEVYVLFPEPERGDLGWSVEDEWLSDCAEELPDDCEGEGEVEHAADPGPQGSHDRADDDALADALGIEDPIGGEVDEHIHNHVEHRHKRDDGVLHTVAFGDLGADGRQHDPAHAVDEGRQREQYDDGVAVGIFLVLALHIIRMENIVRELLLRVKKKSSVEDLLLRFKDEPTVLLESSLVELT